MERISPPRGRERRRSPPARGGPTDRGRLGATPETRVAAARLEFQFLPLLDSREAEPLALHRALAEDPALFAEVLSAAFRARGEEPAEMGESEILVAQRSYELLDSWKLPPGVSEDGVDAEALRGWVVEARRLLADVGRSEIGDQRIGQILRYVPAGTDGTWPHEVIRDLIEELASDDLDLGLALEVRNSRGVTSRGLFEGGAQERELADRYRLDSERLAARWGRTSTVLRRLADEYEREARYEDEQAAGRADRMGDR